MYVYRLCARGPTSDVPDIFSVRSPKGGRCAWALGIGTASGTASDL
jgi:hypothetical protein